MDRSFDEALSRMETGKKESVRRSASAKSLRKSFNESKVLTRVFSSKKPKIPSTEQPFTIAHTPATAPEAVTLSATPSSLSTRPESPPQQLRDSATDEPRHASTSRWGEDENGKVVDWNWDFRIPGSLDVQRPRPMTAFCFDHNNNAEWPLTTSSLRHSPTFPTIQHRSQRSLSQPVSPSASSRPRRAATLSYTFHYPSRVKTLARLSINLDDRVGKAETKQEEARDAIGAEFDLGLPKNPEHPPAQQWPLRTIEIDEEVRSSFRSALTNSSTYNDSSGTERSSVVTKATSINDSPLEASEKSESKHNLMTVEEAIDMYATGFIDNQRPEPYVSDAMSIDERRICSREMFTAIGGRRRNSTETLIAIEGSAEDPLSVDCQAAEIPADACVVDPLLPPPLRTPTKTRDQYGFSKVTDHTTNVQYDAWNVAYTLNQENRSKKWLSYMKGEDLPTDFLFRFPRRCAKTQRYVRKGIPPNWRGAAWFWYAGGPQRLQKEPELYASLISDADLALNDNDKEMIERDLHRTFPDNMHFKPEVPPGVYPLPPSGEAVLLASLRRVLRAFALSCPRIGYCQSLNFIAGLLLLFLPEEKTFWMLRIITTDYLPGTHDMSLEGANIDLWVLMTALKDTMPTLWAKVGTRDGNGGRHDVRLPPISLCTTSWFMSLFIGTLPTEAVLRVWDVLFYEGSRTVFRVALAIFRLGEPRIRAVSDPVEIFQVVQALPRGMLDAGALMHAVCHRGGVSQDWIEKRRRERREWYARARTDGTPRNPPLRTRASFMAKADSVWRRKAGQRTRS